MIKKTVKLAGVFDYGISVKTPNFKSELKVES